MELTLPRSPTISVAIAAYVVSEVTTFTGAAGAPPREGEFTTPSNRAMIDSMSVCLVFVRSDGPDGLNGDLVICSRVRDTLPLVLCAEEHPLALPQGERGNELPRDHAELRRFHVVVTGAEDEALIQLVGRAHVATETRRSRSSDLLLQREQLAAQRPFVVHRPERRTPRESELEPADFRAQRRVGVRAVERRAADLHVG